MRVVYEGKVPGTRPTPIKAIYDRALELTPRALADMAEIVGDHGTDITKRHTPIRTPFDGESPNAPPPGWLRDHIEKIALRIYEASTGRRVYESGTKTEVDYAPYVEFGTGLWGPKHAKYEILPKDPAGVLHWVDSKTGHHVYAKKVMHPGSIGSAMFAIGAAEVEFDFEWTVAHRVRQWAERNMEPIL